MEKSSDGESPTLARTMGLPALLIFGVGDMLGAGIYGLVGRVAHQMGNMVWLAFVGGMVAAVATGLSYAALGSRHPRAAGASYVVGRAFGKPMLAYVVGLTVVASGLTSMATASRVFGGYFTTFVPNAPVSVVSAVFVVLVALVAFRGMRESTWFNALCTGVEVLGLVFIVAVGARFWGTVDYFDARSVANPSGALTLAVLQTGAVLTFYAFIGFEDMINVAEEVRDPEHTLPRALVGALLITTLVYIAIGVTAVSVVPSAELATSERPLVDVALRAAPFLDPEVFAAISLFAVGNTALLNLIMGSRLVYGMARQGLLPGGLGAIHDGRRTPHVAILVLAGVVLVLSQSGDVGTLAKATSVLLLSVFVVVDASLVVLMLRRGEPLGRFEVPIAVPIVGMLVAAVLVAGAGARELTIAAVLVAVISALYFVVRPRVALED